MRIPKLFLGLMTLLLFPLLSIAPARALSCVDSQTVFTTQDVVVRAQVTNRPTRNLVILQVDRYFKGNGPASLEGRVQGIQPGDDMWMDNPEVGKTYLLGFVQQDGNLVHRPCDLFHDLTNPLPAPMVQLIGEGEPPGGGQVTPTEPGAGGSDTPTQPDTTGSDSPAEPDKEGGLPWKVILPVTGAGLVAALSAGWFLRSRRG